MKIKKSYKKQLINYLLLIATISISIILSELTLRKIYPQYSPLDRIKFKYENGIPLGPKDTTQRQWNSNNEYNVVIKFNKYGLREEKDISTASKEDFFVVGDSFSFGHGVTTTERYSGVLQHILKIPVFNISIPTDFDGYEKLIKYTKDNGAPIRNLIIGVCMENDLRFYKSGTEVPVKRNVPAFMEIRVWFQEHTAAYHLISNIIQRKPFLREIAIKLHLIIDKYDSIYSSTYSQQLIDESVYKLKSIVSDYNTYVLIIPSRALWTGKTKEIEQRTHKEFVNKLRNANIKVIDMKPIFEKAADPLQFSFDHDGHWNPKGHHYAAEALADVIRNKYVFVD